ncbi:hypothetical protein EVAR_83445_1 [Eumeta japonica]|uniref:Reverse transcriptase domain-containing protein n=1 Tax=Eumeta variegata TaxID=151549 RepID=A0A4C1TYJ0_EUMVA|nr:hypothetical protein EVAR_83445_1 [Eumeta japonica]
METIPGTSDVVGESHASTSEVESAHREFEDHGADNLENFDRPVPLVPMEVYYEKMLKLQNNQIERLIQALKQPSTSDNKKTNLPEFDPDRSDMEAKAWVQPPHGFPKSSYSGMDWNHFQQIFLSRFDATETSAAALVRVNSSVPADGESMAAFANRTLTTLMARWKDLSVEQIAVSTVLVRCMQIEPRLQRLAHTTELKDRTSMQRELMAYSYKKRTNSDRASNESAKRSKTVTCYTCGRMGHKSNERLRNHKAKMIKMDFKKCSDRRTSPSLAARSRGAEKPSTAEHRRVDTCSVKQVSSQLTHLGQSYDFCFDSGSECSLIKETLANKFGGKRFGSLVTLLGIGNADVNSICQILSKICIDDNVIELLFHVVPDDAINSDIIIGRDLITLGFTVEISNDNLIIKKSKVINLCEVGKPTCHFKDVDTDVYGEHRENLVHILEKYRTSFVIGTPTGCANTGEIEIKLIDPNRTVQRRPYRLSPDERQVCRDKIKELLAANIIKPSCSPFASPILLVKKKDGSDRLCVDYREPNRNTVPDKFPLPLISDQIQRLKGANYFTILDAASGFHQIPVHKDSIERTAFVTPDGQYEYLTMPFGLRNAPSVFQRAMHKALGDLVNTFVVCYLDDMMIVSDNEKEGSYSKPSLAGTETARCGDKQEGYSCVLTLCDVFGGTRGRVTVRIAVSARDTDKLVLAGRVGAERALLFGLWLRRDALSAA